MLIWIGFREHFTSENPILFLEKSERFPMDFPANPLNKILPNKHEKTVSLTYLFVGYFL